MFPLIHLSTIFNLPVCASTFNRLLHSCVCILVQLNKFVVCGSVFKRGYNGDGCLSFRRFCLNANVGWDMVCSELG